MRSHFISFALPLAVGASIPTHALAYSAGKTGAAAGCGPCHGRSASSDTTATLSTGSNEVTAGESVTVRFDVTHRSNRYFGMNVAGTGGTFTAGSGTQVSGGEVTQNGTQSSGSFTFNWTAPSTPGTYVLSGAGNAVDGGFGPLGDAWNVSSDLVLTVCADNDRDGVNTCDGDCDDSDPDVYPDAPELCDGYDQNCDGVADDGLVVSDFYTDADDDGFGFGSVSLTDCFSDAPSGYSDNNEDCDDNDFTAYPGAPDTWYDGVDSDCAGDSDFDMDLDGYDSTTELEGGLDCDDSNADVHPDAEDISGDGIDQNCDGADGGSSSDGGSDASGGSDDADAASEDASSDDEAKSEAGCTTVPAPLALGSWAGLVLFGLARRRRAF